MLAWLIIVAYFSGNVALAAPGTPRVISAMLNGVVLLVAYFAGRDLRDRERAP